jgi:hypothetical protein
MPASNRCRLLGRRPCRREIAVKDAVALSDTARSRSPDLPRVARIAQAIAQMEPFFEGNRSGSGRLA